MSASASATAFDRLRQAAVLILAIGQLGASYVLQFSDGFGEPIGVRSREAQTALTPAGWAFSIWGPIFLALTVYAIAQARPSQGADRLQRRIGWLAAGAFLTCGGWVVVTQGWGTDWRNLAVILALAAFATSAFLIARHDAKGEGAWRWVLNVLPFGLLAGWSTAASFANLTQAAFPLSYEAAPNLAVLVFAAAAGSVGLIAARGAFVYALPLVWAFTAIWAADREPSVALASAAAAGAIAAIAVALKLLWPERKTPRS